MTMRISPLLSGVAGIALLSGGFMSGALAADLPTKKDSAPPPAATSCLLDPWTFMNTDCPLTYKGITVYGVIDVGVGWESHGAPFNSGVISGVQELIRPSGNRALWLATPGGLSQSQVGIKAKEEIAPNWYFVSDLSFAFDPYSLTPANGPNSFAENNGVALNHQSSTGDSSRAGQWYNGVGYVGISNPTYGTLTVGRVNSLTLDGIIDYDPMGASYAFSVIGWQGIGSGGGDTEDARLTGAKYRVDVGNFRAAAVAQFGGYAMNNGAQAVYEGGVGGDFALPYGGLSVDAVYSYDKGAVSANILKASQIAAGAPLDTLRARISDDNTVQLLAKWTFERWKLYGGYEFIQFRNPTDPQLSSFQGIGGYWYDYAAGSINNTAFTHPENLQILWIGGRYQFTDKLDGGLAYYQYFQNSFGEPNCSNSSSDTCSGTLEAVSFDLDYKINKKFDVYGGMMFSEVNNGLSNGFLHGENLAPTAGLRFRF
jgi:predicted porin